MPPDPLILAQSIAVTVLLWLVVALPYLKGELDRVLCMEHNLVVGQMFWSGHLDSKQTTKQIFGAIVDNKF